MKTRWKILAVFCAFFGVFILLTIIHHYQLRFAVEKYAAELKAKGEPMELAQVIPTPVSPDKNSASFFLKAAALLATNTSVLDTNSPTAMLAAAPGKSIISWQQPEIRSFDGTNSWKEIGEALEPDGSALNLLLQITNLALFDFHVSYDLAFDIQLTHLTKEKKSALRLATRALYDLHQGETKAAAENLRPIFVLVNGTADERLAISQLVRIAIAHIGIAATWEFLQATNLSDENLADLQTALSQMEFIHAEAGFLPVERQGSHATLMKWRHSDMEFDKFFSTMKKAHEIMGTEDVEEADSFWDAAKFKMNRFLWRYWWSYTDELQSLKGYEVLMNTAHSVETNGSFYAPLVTQSQALDELGISKLNNSLDTLFSGQVDFHSMISESIVTLGYVIKKVMQIEASKQMAVTAVALKRYQLKHGTYPADLSALVPDFVTVVPQDPVDGRPLRYHVTPDGTFLLYSIGENGQDDGGNASSPRDKTAFTGYTHYLWYNHFALDWVWPQPATAAEISSYYAHPPK